MYLKEINLVNYRNIHNIKFTPSAKYNILYGDNGQGKTNIIESIYLLGYLKSFRQTRNADFIGKYYKNCNIIDNIYFDNISIKYNLEINSKAKLIKIDGKTPESSDYLNYVKSVLYSTDELIIFRGSNILRKNFIDRGIFLIDKNYLSLVKKYNFILKSRNAILKQIKKNTYSLESWSQLLVETGSIIRKIRYEYIENLNTKFSEIYNVVFKEKDKAYISAKKIDTSLENIKKDFFSSLIDKLEQDINYGQTLSGPHLDKVDFYIGDKNLKYYGSQGQLRIILLSLKLSQIYEYKQLFNKYPILLLDDICSELDLKKINSLFDYISGNIGQIFITTTCKNNLDFLNMENSNFYRIDSGEITLG